MKEYFENLIIYENWANKEVITSLTNSSKVTDRILSLMSHIINAQLLWLNRLQGDPGEVKVWHNYELDDLLTVHDGVAGRLSRYTGDLKESDLENYISYANTKGENFNSKVIDILTHMTHHSAYHRGQVIILLKELSSALPQTDFIHYKRSVKN